ncbi:hypothetical protein CDV55_105833 [Aspergillus turcosus]|nr:hypothetical protein CDV55_105833 [Aspergillus turcosus]
MKCPTNKLQVEKLSEADHTNDENELRCSKQMRGGSQIWSVKSKLFHTVVPCLAAFLSTFGASVLEPAVTDVMADFCVGRTQATLCITLYTLGLATGPLVLSPISEAYGRRWVYIPAISFVLAFSAGAAAAKGFAILLTCRFFSGFFCSVGIAVGGGTVADIWPRGKQRATASLLFVLAPFLALTLGPTAGAYVLHIRHANWRWTQWMVVFFCLPLWLMFVVMRETSGEQPLHDANNGWEEIRLSARSFYLPLRLLFTDYIILSLTVYTSFSYAAVFSYFSSLQHVLMLDYGFDTRQASLGLLSQIVGNFCAIILWVVLEKAATSSEEKLPGKVFQPERHLYAGVIGGLLMCLAEIWFALAGRPGGTWVNLVATGIPLGCGAFALFLSTIAYIIDIYPAEVVASDAASHKLVKPHILRGTHIMFAYRGSNTSLAELEGISTVVQLGQSLLRHDLAEFTKSSLHAWLRGGLWPHVNWLETYEEDIGEQCSMDMMQAEVEEDVKVKLMLR